MATLALSGSLAERAVPSGPFAEAAPCDGPGSDPWVSDLRSRVLAYDGLARFAFEHFGEPVACDGVRTDDFDGLAFGSLRLTFPGAVTLDVTTMPPETSVVTLTAASGFPDEGQIREALAAHAADRGLAIDWSTPEVGTSGDEVTHTFWDPDPGLNGSAALVFREGVLVAVRAGLAL